MKEKFYVTTAIDYVNSEPHIGHAYQKIVADTLARWNRKKGKEVLFVTGTDEHGKKIEDAAKSLGIETKKFVDINSSKFKEAWKALNISYDRFIRTTDEDHKRIVSEIIIKCNESGDIYKSKYTGFYCTGCEAYKTERELVNGKCPIHPKNDIEKISEEAYFFRLSKYRDFLLKLHKETDFCIPKERRNEVISRIEEGLNDFCITRSSFKWGIPFPLDKNHITYVWFDALINYYTATREKGREDFWGKPTVHIIGKDNTWFHNVYWPAMLKSAGLELPFKTINHGFLTFNGQKISKSLGNSISPISLVEKYGCDSVRYFCLRHFSFTSGSDGDFDESALVERYNNELANKLGNLVSRISALVKNYGMEKCKNSLIKKLKEKEIDNYMENFEVDKALNQIFAFIDECNEYIQKEKPWENKDKKIIYETYESLTKIADLIEPFMPETANKIRDVLNNKVKDSIIFKKIDKKLTETKIEAELSTEKINLFEFEKIKMIVAKIIDVDDVKEADKIYKLKLDIGGKEKTVCAGIKNYYKKEDLIGKKVIYLSNLLPRKIKGIESEGMILAASDKDKSKVRLIIPDGDIEQGSIIG